MAARRAIDVAEYAKGVRAGDRGILSRAITLVESVKAEHRQKAHELLQELLPHSGGAHRVGISGVPGVGKSTFIEALGTRLTGDGHKVAVLAVDPSSTRSGGSILGDKTRMTELGRHPRAFIRPSPSAGTLGGVARRTREAMLLCEAAGFDVVFVETVGVGQSEVAVADLVDLFLLVASPAGGDELQGIKRGIMELADLIVVNKSDGDLVGPSQRAAAELRRAVRLLRPKRPGWDVPVIRCSAITGDGIPDVWDAVRRSHEQLRDRGDLDRLRAAQNVAWMWSEVTADLLDGLRSHPEVQADLDALEAQVAAGRRSPASAAEELLRRFGVGGSHRG